LLLPPPGFAREAFLFLVGRSRRDVLATFDVSNTRITLGLLEGEAVRATCALAADPHRTADEYALLVAGFLRERGLTPEQIASAVVASVVPPLTETIGHVCRRVFLTRPLVVGAGTRTGIRISTRNPREVGPDRIVNAVAAIHLHGSPAIVVDFDTATVFDVIAADGSYAGCAIAPGLSLAAEALVRQASLLPRVELCAPDTAVGRDTASALQSGVVLGHCALVEGMVARIRLEIGEQSVVVATGDLAPLIAAGVPAIQHVAPHLSLLGLRLIHELNAREGRL
jgi:type III pantothenate kinase